MVQYETKLKMTTAKGEKGDYYVSVYTIEDGCYTVTVAPVTPGLSQGYGWSQYSDSEEELIADAVRFFEENPPEKAKLHR